MELQVKTLINTLTPQLSKQGMERKLVRLSDLVGIKIVRDTILEIYTKDEDNNINFDLVDIVELYAIKKKIKDAINRKQAIIAVMQQLKALKDLGIDEIDISGYHLSSIKECSTNIT